MTSVAPSTRRWSTRTQEGLSGQVRTRALGGSAPCTSSHATLCAVTSAPLTLMRPVPRSGLTLPSQT